MLVLAEAVRVYQCLHFYAQIDPLGRVGAWFRSTGHGIDRRLSSHLASSEGRIQRRERDFVAAFEWIHAAGIVWVRVFGVHGLRRSYTETRRKAINPSSTERSHHRPAPKSTDGSRVRPEFQRGLYDSDGKNAARRVHQRLLRTDELCRRSRVLK